MGDDMAEGSDMNTSHYEYIQNKESDVVHRVIVSDGDTYWQGG